ncbi:MAG TPA: hypothetical protein VGU90_16735 [Terriglobales bacterium]|nr:hypothetical protein [Terriglobales bacterium]
MSTDKNEAVQQLNKQFWETMARSEALRNIAASQRSEEDAARFIQRAKAEEDRAKEFMKQAEDLAKSGTDEQ